MKSALLLRAFRKPGSLGMAGTGGVKRNQASKRMLRISFRLSGHKAMDCDRSFLAVCDGVHYCFGPGCDITDSKDLIYAGLHGCGVYRNQSAADLKLQCLAQEGEVGFLAYGHKDRAAVKRGGLMIIVRRGKMTLLIKDGSTPF